MAAAWGNIKPVHMMFGDPLRKAYNLQPHFWRALTSEPCFWGFSNFKAGASQDDLRAMMASPFALQHEQCHY